MENQTFAKRIEAFDGTYVEGMYFGSDPVNECCFLTALLTPAQRKEASELSWVNDGICILDWAADKLEISPITAEEAVHVWDEFHPPVSAADYMAALLDDDPNRRDLLERLEERGYIHYL